MLAHTACPAKRKEVCLFKGRRQERQPKRAPVLCAKEEQAAAAWHRQAVKPAPSCPLMGGMLLAVRGYKERKAGNEDAPLSTPSTKHHVVYTGKRKEWL